MTEAVETVENLQGHEYDRIRKQVKNGELIVTGEAAVAERSRGAWRFLHLLHPRRSRGTRQTANGGDVAAI